MCVCVCEILFIYIKLYIYFLIRENKRINFFLIQGTGLLLFFFLTHIQKHGLEPMEH